MEQRRQCQETDSSDIRQVREIFNFKQRHNLTRARSMRHSYS